MKKQDFINKYGVEAYERHKEYQKQYRVEHKEQIAAQKKQYRAEHKEERTEYMKQYRTIPLGRANYLAGGYRQMDKEKGFLNVVNQVNSDFILNNIFNSSCIYCGETDWTKLGCDRIDNDKPHTVNNVVCSCWNCNHERKAMNFGEFMAMKKSFEFNN